MNVYALFTIAVCVALSVPLLREFLCRWRTRRLLRRHGIL